MLDFTPKILTICAGFGLKKLQINKFHGIEAKNHTQIILNPQKYLNLVIVLPKTAS